MRTILFVLFENGWKPFTEINVEELILENRRTAVLSILLIDALIHQFLYAGALFKSQKIYIRVRRQYQEYIILLQIKKFKLFLIFLREETKIDYVSTWILLLLIALNVK